VLVDQLVSLTPGLIAQVTGFLTKKQCRCATAYVNQASSFGCVHLQKEASAEEMIQGKKAFEMRALSMGVAAKACHAGNGNFKAKAQVVVCQQKKQHLTFTAVGAHHTNGKAER